MEGESSKTNGPMQSTAAKPKPKKKQPNADDSSVRKEKQPTDDEKSYESRLAAAVRRQPGLYDRESSEYRGTRQKDSLWATVATELGVTGIESQWWRHEL